MATGRDLINLLDHVQQNRQLFGARRANRLEKICYRLLYNRNVIDTNISTGIDMSSSLAKLKNEYIKLIKQIKG